MHGCLRTSGPVSMAAYALKYRGRSMAAKRLFGKSFVVALGQGTQGPWASNCLIPMKVKSSRPRPFESSLPARVVAQEPYGRRPRTKCLRRMPFVSLERTSPRPVVFGRASSWLRSPVSGDRIISPRLGAAILPPFGSGFGFNRCRGFQRSLFWQRDDNVTFDLGVPAPYDIDGSDQSPRERP